MVGKRFIITFLVLAVVVPYLISFFSATLFRFFVPFSFIGDVEANEDYLDEEILTQTRQLKRMHFLLRFFELKLKKKFVKFLIFFSYFTAFVIRHIKK